MDLKPVSSPFSVLDPARILAAAPNCHQGALHASSGKLCVCVCFGVGCFDYPIVTGILSPDRTPAQTDLVAVPYFSRFCRWVQDPEGSIAGTAVGDSNEALGGQEEESRLELGTFHR